MSESKEEFQHLTDACGHHCGAQVIGASHMHVKHCICQECHGDDLEFVEKNSK